MTITLACLINVVFTPAFASALTAGTISLRILLHDPLFMLFVFVGFFALGGSLIAICVLLYRRAKSAEGVLSSRLGGGGQLDFSGIETPSEIQMLCFSDEEGAGSGKNPGNSTVLPIAAAGDEGPVFLDDELDMLGESDTLGTRKKPGDPSDNLFDTLEIEEPTERPSMEFTDDMIQQVIAGIERRREAERTQRQEEQWWVEQVEQTELQPGQREQTERQQPEQTGQPGQTGQAGQQPELPAQTEQQAGRQQAKAVIAPRVTEKEKSGQQAAIEWLAPKQRRQGRHFRPMHSRVQGDETKTENLTEHTVRTMKHSREQEEALYQRVG
jgi:hypothetical protein